VTLEGESMVIVHHGVTHGVRKGKPFPVYWDVVREGE
jgi:hypothetical protein